MCTSTTYKGHSNENREEYIKLYIAKTECININLQCSPHTSSNVPLRHKFLGRRTLLVAVSATHAPPVLPCHPICRDVHVGRLLGGQKRGKSLWCQMWWTWCTGWYFQFGTLDLLRGLTGCLRSGVVTLQTRARIRQTVAFRSNCWLKLLPKHITVPSTVRKRSVITGCLSSGVVILHKHARRRQTVAFRSNCWLKLLPKHSTVPSTVRKRSVITGCYMLRTVYNFSGFYLNCLCIYALLLWRCFRNYVI